MEDYKREQLLIILTTTLSLLTAWSWNNVIQQYILEHYDNSLTTLTLTALVITVVTFILINAILQTLDIKEERLKKLKKANMTDYVIGEAK